MREQEPLGRNVDVFGYLYLVTDLLKRLEWFARRSLDSSQANVLGFFLEDGACAPDWWTSVGGKLSTAGRGMSRQ